MKKASASTAAFFGRDTGTLSSIFLFGDGNLSFYTSNGDSVSFSGGYTQLFDNNWHNVVFRRSSASVKLYIDGAYQDEQSLTTGASSNFVFTSMGARYGDGGYRITGSLGYVSMYTAALTDAEIKQNFSVLADRYREKPLNGLEITDARVVFDASNVNGLKSEASGTCDNLSWTDLSTNGSDTTLTNFCL